MSGHDTKTLEYAQAADRGPRASMVLGGTLLVTIAIFFGAFGSIAVYFGLFCILSSKKLGAAIYFIVLLVILMAAAPNLFYKGGMPLRLAWAGLSFGVIVGTAISIACSA